MKTGFGLLPMTAMIFIVAPTIQTRVLPRVGVRPIVMTGMTLGRLSMGCSSPPGSVVDVLTGVLPGLVLLGIGMPCVFAPSFATATLGCRPKDAGVASRW